MKKVLYGVVGGLFAIILCAVLVFFGFEKKIPENWVGGQIDTIKATKTEDYKEEAKNLKFYYEKINYTKDGEKTIVTFDEKYDLEIKNTSKDDAPENESYYVKNVEYDTNGSYKATKITKYYIEDSKKIKEEDGNKQEITDFGEIYLGYAFVFSDFITNEGNLKPEIINMIENHLDKVTQKGMNITLHLVEDNILVNITFGLTKNKIIQIERIEDTYTDNVLSAREYVKLAIG